MTTSILKTTSSHSGGVTEEILEVIEGPTTTNGEEKDSFHQLMIRQIAKTSYEIANDELKALVFPSPYSISPPYIGTTLTSQFLNKGEKVKHLRLTVKKPMRISASLANAINIDRYKDENSKAASVAIAANERLKRNSLQSQSTQTPQNATRNSTNAGAAVGEEEGKPDGNSPTSTAPPPTDADAAANGPRRLAHDGAGTSTVRSRSQSQSPSKRTAATNAASSSSTSNQQHRYPFPESRRRALDYCTDLEKGIIREINRLRQRPRLYLNELIARRSEMIGSTVWTRCSGAIRLIEGTTAIDEAIEFLKAVVGARAAEKARGGRKTTARSPRSTTHHVVPGIPMAAATSGGQGTARAVNTQADSLLTSPRPNLPRPSSMTTGSPISGGGGGGDVSPSRGASVKLQRPFSGTANSVTTTALMMGEGDFDEDDDDGSVAGNSDDELLRDSDDEEEAPQLDEGDGERGSRHLSKKGSSRTSSQRHIRSIDEAKATRQKEAATEGGDGSGNNNDDDDDDEDIIEPEPGLDLTPSFLRIKALSNMSGNNTGSSTLGDLNNANTTKGGGGDEQGSGSGGKHGKSKKSPKPLGILAVSTGLCLAAQDHAFDIGPRGLTTHRGTTNESCVRERVERYGVWLETCYEIMSFGVIDPVDMVCQFLIDDGVPKRFHRHLLLSTKFGDLGIKIAPHAVFGVVCVIVLAGRFMTFGTRELPTPSGFASQSSALINATRSAPPPRIANLGETSLTCPKCLSVVAKNNCVYGPRGEGYHRHCLLCHDCHSTLSKAFYIQPEENESKEEGNHDARKSSVNRSHISEDFGASTVSANSQHLPEKGGKILCVSCYCKYQSLTCAYCGVSCDFSPPLKPTSAVHSSKGKPCCSECFLNEATLFNASVKHHKKVNLQEQTSPSPISFV